MNIMIIQPTGDKFGHFGIYTTKLAQELANLGNNITVVTNRLEVSKYLLGSAAFELIEVESGKYKFEDLERKISQMPIKYWLGYFRNSWKITKFGLSLCKKKNYDAIYITDAEFMLATIALKIYKKYIPHLTLMQFFHMIQHFHGIYMHYTKSHNQYLVVKIILKMH